MAKTTSESIRKYMSLNLYRISLHIKHCNLLAKTAASNSFLTIDISLVGVILFFAAMSLLQKLLSFKCHLT